MDDNIWEYPFGDLEDEDDEMFYRATPHRNKVNPEKHGLKKSECDKKHNVI
jgi:hypothetical protein